MHARNHAHTVHLHDSEPLRCGAAEHHRGGCSSCIRRGPSTSLSLPPCGGALGTQDCDGALEVEPRHAMGRAQRKSACSSREACILRVAQDRQGRGTTGRTIVCAYLVVCVCGLRCRSSCRGTHGIRAQGEEASAEEMGHDDDMCAYNHALIDFALLLLHQCCG